jgi:hypothetical protein
MHTMDKDLLGTFLRFCLIVTKKVCVSGILPAELGEVLCLVERVGPQSKSLSDGTEMAGTERNGQALCVGI